MIFRIKHRWHVALTVTVCVALACWALGGWRQVAAGPWPLEWQIGGGLLAGLGTIILDGLLHETFRFTMGPRYLAAFHRHGVAVLGPMRWPEYLAGGLMAAVAEEPLFRGVLFHALLQTSAPPAVVVFISGLIFAACHWLDRTFLPFWFWALAEGLVFGVLLIATGSLLVPMIAHGMHDLVGYRAFQTLIRERPWDAKVVIDE